MTHFGWYHDEVRGVSPSVDTEARVSWGLGADILLPGPHI